MVGAGDACSAYHVLGLNAGGGDDRCAERGDGGDTLEVHAPRYIE